MGKILIYGLYSDENPEKIKYVGKTKQRISKRVHDHIRESYKLKTKKDVWIQSVLKGFFSIGYVILEECNVNNWLEREKFWINEIKDLTNTSKGGDGGRGLIAVKTYDELKSFVRDYMSNIKNKKEWVVFVNDNPNFNFLPKHPYSSYKNRGWVGWDDLLINFNGYNNGRRNAFRDIFTYIECKDYIKQFKILDSKDWRNYISRFDNRVPTAPDFYYTKTGEWCGWGEFLGNGNIHNRYKKMLNYFDASKKIKTFGFKKFTDFEKFVKLNGLIDGIPRHPNRFYTKTGEWCGWCEFLK